MCACASYAKHSTIPTSNHALLTTHRHQGQIGAALVLGGFDIDGPQLFTIAPHGSTDKLPYVTMGSGSLAAMAVFESRWKKNLDVRVIFFGTT